MFSKSLSIGLLLLISPIKTLAHGETELGPNGGIIRMPGAFHTEIVKDKHAFRIYLLDLEWKNPITKNSSVDLQLITEATSLKFNCKAKDTYFLCQSQKTFPEKGMLKLEANRVDQKGMAVNYELPLATEKSSH